MSRKRVPPEAQIIALFSGLSDESQRMVMFGLNAMMAQSAPKSIAPSAEKKSSRKPGARNSIPSSETVMEGVIGVVAEVENN